MGGFACETAYFAERLGLRRAQRDFSPRVNRVNGGSRQGFGGVAHLMANRIGERAHSTLYSRVAGTSHADWTTKAGQFVKRPGVEGPYFTDA